MLGEKDFSPGRSARGGYILLAVIVFIALLLPLTTLVLSTVGQETVAANNLIVETKTRMAADAAVNGALSVLIERQVMPDYFVSGLPQHVGRAIVVDDNGILRWNSGSAPNLGAGLDGIYGTDDDYYIGPFKDRKMIGPSGTSDPFAGYNPDSPRNYKIDFRYVNWHKPTYLAENWALFGKNNPFAFNRASGKPVYLFNQFAAIHDAGSVAGGMYASDWRGYHPEQGTIFPPNRWVMPGYYPSAKPPANTEITGTLGTIGGTDDKGKLAQSTVALYNPLTNDFGTTDGLKGEVSVTDEAGRLNLNIFCKKVPVWARENELTDFDRDGNLTDDFNENGVPGELIWKWMDNPLFPDRNTVIPISNSGNGTDFNGNDVNEVWLGENLQHYYAPDWVDYADKSIAMLTSLPGVDVELAKNILRALNPDLSTLPAGYNPNPSGVSVNPPETRRADAPNLTPHFYAFDLDFDLNGQIIGVSLDYTTNVSSWDLENDDVPLPRPRPFTDIKQLLDVSGMTKQKYRRLTDFVTVFSYDTNVIGSEIWDSQPTGGDNDALNDVRYNINTVVRPATLASYREEADRVWSFFQNHLTDSRFKKFTLPVLDRRGYTREDPEFQAYGSGGHTPYFLNPELTRDSILSIILYRNGYRSEDAYSYDPAGIGRQVNPGTPFGNLFGLFFGNLSNSFIPLPEFQPSYVADSNRGRNTNATIPGITRFESVADLLEVPLYKFDNLVVHMLADPPSAAVCNDGDSVTVNYLVSFSDVITAEEYDPSLGLILPVYTVQFDYNGDGVVDFEQVIDMDDGIPDNDFLSLRSQPPTADRPAIIGTFDMPLYRELQFQYPGNPATWRANNYISFSHTFNYSAAGGGNIPSRDPSRAGTTFPGNPNFAYDANGDPFITARVTVVKNMPSPDGDPPRALRADDVAKVYLQHNCQAVIPLRTNILAMRTGNNTYQVISRTAGGNTANGPVYVYDWDYIGFPDDSIVDGIVTAPSDWSNIRVAPSIRLDPWSMAAGGGTTDPLGNPLIGRHVVRLSVWDIWGADTLGAPGGYGWPFPWDRVRDFKNPANQNYGNIGHLPFNGPNVDAYFDGGGGPPAWLFPPAARHMDFAEVYPLATTGELFTQLATYQPAVQRGQSTIIRAGAWGGRAPYSFQITVRRIAAPNYTYVYTSGSVGSNIIEIGTDELVRTSLAYPLRFSDTDGVYNVTLRVTDSTQPVPLVKDLTPPATNAQQIFVGSSTVSTSLHTDIPNLTVSAKLVPYERGVPTNQRRFLGVASVSGGRTNYLLRWDVKDENGQTINQNHPTGNTPMIYTSVGQTPTFTFNPTLSSNGVYFVYCSVIDSTGINPNTVNSSLATDVVPVLLAESNDFRVMPTIYANPPGNAYTGTRRSPSPMGTPTVGGSPQIGTFFISGVNSIEPRTASIGDIIEIRGVNFNTTAANNSVTFEGGMVASPLSVVNDPLHPAPGGNPQQQILRVRVPSGATSGFVYVTNTQTGGRSQTASVENFFQTDWVVSFDLYSTHRDTYNVNPLLSQTYMYEVDFQGDGIFDWSIQTQDTEVLSENNPGLRYDYSGDGIGNYQATVRVTNVTTQKAGISHQLIQMRDLTDYALNRAQQTEALGLTANILPDYRTRQPIPTEVLRINSFVDGTTNPLGLGYKWNIDTNSRVHSFLANRIAGGISFLTGALSPFTSSVVIRSTLDARYATPNTPIDVTVRVHYPFDVNEPSEPLLNYDVGSYMSTFNFDMDDDGTVDVANVRGVVVQRGPNFSVEEVKFSYQYAIPNTPDGYYSPSFTAFVPWGPAMPGTAASSNRILMPRIRISTFLATLVIDVRNQINVYEFDIVDLQKQNPANPTPPWTTPPSFDVAGNQVSLFPPGREFYVIESANNDGLYSVVSATYLPGPNRTRIVVAEPIQTAVVRGKIVFSTDNSFTPNIYDGMQHYIGLTVLHNRLKDGEISRISGSDSITLPVIQQGANNVYGYNAFNPSYSLNNSQGASAYNMLGILGASAELLYKADINSDGFLDVNDIHTRSTPLRNTLVPLAITGIGFPTQPNYGWFNRILGIPEFPLGDITIPYEANRGIYTSWGMTLESIGGQITLDSRNIWVDTQEIMVGGRTTSSGGGPGSLPLTADMFIDPLAGSVSQTYMLESYVAGGTGPYTYDWRVFYEDGSPLGVPISLADGQSVFPLSYFTPGIDAVDEETGGLIPQIEGMYRIELRVADTSGGPVVTDIQYIRVIALGLQAQLFVNPPAGTIGQDLEYWVHIDGGKPPYTVKIDFADGGGVPGNPNIQTINNVNSQFAIVTHAYDQPSFDQYHVKIEVLDSSIPQQIVGGVNDGTGNPEVADDTPNHSQSIAIGDRIPLAISLMASPPSGFDAFPIDVHYAVAGGVSGASRFGGGNNSYIVMLNLLDENGNVVDSWNGTGKNTFGADGLPDTTPLQGRSPGFPPTGYSPPGISTDPDVADANRDRPVQLFVPRAGKFFLQGVVLDGDFQLAFSQKVIYSEGYIAPDVYDDLGAPRIRYTLEPLDPTDSNSTLIEKPMHAVRVWVDPLYDPPNSTFGSSRDNDTRVMEADLQLLGELFTVDPNPNIFYSSNFSPSRNPLDARMFEVSLATDPTDPNSTTDFYDTFTMGRVNINTASEEVLTAIFSNIVAERGYYYTNNSGDPDFWRNGQRNYEEDRLITPQGARALARAVVDYRNSFYDSQLPEVSGYSNYEVGTSNVRVSHLPVIGPWDGANPREYSVSDRNASLPTFDGINVDNVYDNYAGNYYNLDDAGYKFYAPSDIAVVRAQLPGESDSDYAKYLNHVSENDGDGFDARYYFTYDESAGETAADARNRIAIVRNTDSEGNEHVVFSWISNPPFQSIYDLFKVLGMAENNAGLNPNPTDFTIDTTTGRPNYSTTSANRNERVFSGPSVFRYIERWVPTEPAASGGTNHAWKGRYEVVTNYLSDIAPYLTVRSYVFRVEGKGVIPTSQIGAGNAFQTGRLSRDKNVMAIVDTGPLYTSQEGGLFRGLFGGSIAPNDRLSHKVLYWQDVKSDDVTR